MTTTAEPSPPPLRGLAALRDQLRSREISILIGGGVAMLVLIILIGAASAVLGLRTIAQGYARQQSFSAVAQTATAIDEHLLRLRVAASEYLLSGRQLDRERMIESSRALVSRVEAGSLALREVGFGEIVDAIRARLDLQRSVIETLGELRERRSRTSDEFVRLSNEALTMLDEIVPRAFEFGDFEGSNRALRLRENLLAAQGEVLVWLLTRRKMQTTTIADRWTDLVSATRRLQFTLREVRDRDATSTVRARIEPQGALVADLDQVSQDESSLDRILDQENGLIQSLSDQLRARATSGEAQLSANLNATLARARQWTILFASLAGMVGLLSAAYSFRRTVRPIRRITKTLDALASGRLDTPVPFVNARNELGQMARAADVFKNAMAEVQRSRAVFQTVLDNLPDGVMLFDKDKRWLMWNRQLAEFQRFPPEIARVGAPADEILRFQAVRGDFGPGDPEQYVKAGLERMWTPGGVRYHRWSAGGRYIEFNFQPLPGGELLGYYRDLTEMKETQDAVQQARERLQGAIEGLANGFALYDSEDRLVIWNQRFAEFKPDISDILKVGVSFEDIIRARVARGATAGVVDMVGREEAWIAERVAYHRKLDGVVISRTPDGGWLQLNKRRTPSGDTVSIFTDITEIKQKEEEITRATERLQGAIEGLASGFALYDSDDRLVIWNKRFEEFTPGVAPYLRGGADFSDILRAAAEKGQFRDAVGNEEAWLAERVAYHRSPEGHLVNQLPDGRWVQLNKRRTPSGDTVSVFTDITEIKQKEEEVTKATELLQDAIEGLASGFAIYDEDGSLMIWNTRFEELTPHLDGLRKAGVKLEDMLRAALSAGKIYQAKGREEEWLASFMLRHRDASERTVTQLEDGRWVHIEKQRTKAGHIVSVFTDVSDMKKGEQAVRDAQDRLQDAIESLGSGFILCDPETRLIAWNSRMLELLPGVKPHFTVGARLGDVIRFALNRKILKNVELQGDDWINDRRAGAPRQSSQSVVETNAGQWLHATRRVSANGNTVAILTDITEMKHREIELDRLVTALETARDAAYKAQSDAEAANQAKSTFLATMSHEIRTPMNGVLGMLEVLEHGDLGDRQREQVRLARHSAMSLLNIIDDVLDFSKIEAGRLALESVDVDMLALVEGVAETMTEGAKRKGLALYAEVDPLLPENITGDPTRLRQVLFNLVGNAIKFTESGSVSIVAESTVRDGRAYMRLTIADTGIGMSKEQRERLFIPFEQADTTTTRRFGGTGLGLSIVARLVELMGGSVTAQSAPGHGSVFTVDIPIAAGAKSAARKPQLSGLSIGVAMADNDAAKRLAGHLGRAGASVEILSADPESGGVNMGVACDMVIAERTSFFDPRGAGRARGPRRRIYLDGWDAKPADESTRSVAMPWRVDSIIAAAASLVGRRIEETRRAPIARSDRWVHDIDDRDARIANGAARPALAAESDAARRNILIVDDHPVNREVIRRQLELLGHDADEAENGSAAFALWQGGRHRIVITDCHMPVLDGFGLTAAIRAAEEGGSHRTPIVALTANALAGESDRCLAAGMDDYLAKPVPLDKLRTTIERWLSPGDKKEPAPKAEPQEKGEAMLDRSVLADLFGDDDSTISRLIGTFVETTRASLADIDHAFNGGDVSSISDIAHRMKGSARMVGAQKLAHVAEEIEKAAKAGDVAAAKAHLRNLQSAVEKTLAAAVG